ncbi:MAG: imidazole glycerol phosphate synthase subunit HisH [Clostridiales bacterium]|nr:imidazole glycerol phosphate synthase subunit HisH [Clostridiales bacterium]
MIGIIDYGAGNLKSVQNALTHLGIDWRMAEKPADFGGCDGLILPGVGSFGAAMDRLYASGLAGPIRDWAAGDRPLLGICLGLQLLFEESEESPGVQGLGVFSGRFRRFPDDMGLKVPHIGWNSLSIRKTEGIFRDVKQGACCYFVHSYYLEPDGTDLAALCEYGLPFGAAVERGRVGACQFHPEKSGETGLAILRRFAEICKEGGR